MRAALALLLAAALLPGCAKGDTDGPLTVVTGVYPLAYVARHVGGPNVTVIDLAPQGAEPHDLELTPTQVAEVERATLVLLVRGLQPALDDAAGVRAVDALEDASGTDPHVWLDPILLGQLATRLGDRLAAVDPDHARDYRFKADGFVQQMASLNGYAAGQLAGCARRDLVTSHAAFGRFASRYRLRETGIAGVDAEAEPSPRRIADVVALVKERGVTTVFAESADDATARTVAREAGVEVGVLDPVEVFRGEDYMEVMSRNVDTIKRALGC